MAEAGTGDADAYEAMRQAAMEAKATMLAELGMGETKSNLEQRARASKRPRASSAKARASSARAAALAEPTRRSRRVAGREAEAAAGLPKELEYVTSASLSRSFAERSRPEGTVGLERLIQGISNQDLSNAQALCREIAAPPAAPGSKKARRGTAGSAGGGGATGRKGKSDPADEAAAMYRGLRIQSESHVAKVTPDRSYSCCFTGRSDVVVCWVGDKWGRVGAFRPLAAAAEEDESDLITLFAPHTRSVGSVMSPADAPDRVISSSYDGSVRVFDAAAMRSSETIVWDEHLSYATGCSVDHHPSLPLVLTSSNDTTVKLWDVRALGKTRKRATGGKAQSATPLAVFGHGRGASSAFFSPDGERIVSTGNDDLIRVWGGGGKTGPVCDMADAKTRFVDPAKVAIKHNNHTGRWLSNFRTVFEPLSGGHLVLVGAMGTRRIQLYSAFTGKLLHEAGDEEQLTAVPTINAFHPSLPLILSTTASGRAHLWS